MKNKILITLILLAIAATDLSACTTAVISGKHTKDGRPLLWKHRDTWAINNKIMQFDDGKYAYTGLVNSSDSIGESVWIGFNSTGFAIMNSASYNLNNDTIEQSGLEGRLMKKALQTCASVDEFEQMLNNLPKPIKLEANFGVIDAQGGAAYFELGNFIIVKIDANDPAVAPMGYVIRTNYSFTGETSKGGGYIRYVTANSVFENAAKRNNLSVKAILQDASRNMTHSLIGTNMWEVADRKEGKSQMEFFVDYIPRSGSSSAIVIEGVNSNEDTRLTTMWTVLGFPLTSVTVPIWLTKNQYLPDVVTYDNDIKDAPLCHFALELKANCYSYNWGASSKYYININPLINTDNTGYLQVLPALDNSLFDKGHDYLEKWREGGVDENEMLDYYNWADEKIFDFYGQLFGLTK